MPGRWRSQLDDAPAPAVTPCLAQHPETKLLSDPSTVSPGRKEALSSPSQTRQASPDKPLSSEAGCGAGDRQCPHLEANKAACKCPQRAVSNVYPILLSFLSRAERVEEGSQCRSLSTAIRAGVSTSEQSPRPDVSAGTRTRARCCAPRGTQLLLARRPCLVTLRVLLVPARKAVCCPSVHGQTSRRGFQEGVGHPCPARS